MRDRSGNLRTLLWVVLALGLQGSTSCRFAPTTSVRALSENSLLKGSPFYEATSYHSSNEGRALLVMDGGNIVFEHYREGFSADTPNAIFSGTKSFNCALYAAMVQDGLLTGPDDLVSDTITEWAQDGTRKGMTIQHLLQQTSGIEQRDSEYLLYTGNRYYYALKLPQKSAPGSTFTYGEIHFAVFGEVLRRKLVLAGASLNSSSASRIPETPEQYLYRRILNPIGMKVAQWEHDGAGNLMLSYGASVTAREWAKFGRLMLEQGMVQGRPILPQNDLETCRKGSIAMPGYGMALWLNAPMPDTFHGIFLGLAAVPSFTSGGPTGLIEPGGPASLYSMNGSGDNRVYLYPDRQRIVVRLARGGMLSAWSDARFLDLLPPKDVSPSPTLNRAQ